jgi:hypothetical protein
MTASLDSGAILRTVEKGESHESEPRDFFREPQHVCQQALSIIYRRKRVLYCTRTNSRGISKETSIYIWTNERLSEKHYK